MRRSLTKNRNDRGAVAIEVVIVLPILLVLIVGTIVLGNFLAVKTQTTGLARDGARAAALRQPLPADTVVIGSPCPNPADPTRFVTVEATKPVTLRIIPLLPTLPDTITETVTMRCGG
jgi:hypothetical protein